jgi:hypothetical protein
VAQVDVVPESFEYVFYDAGAIREIVERMARLVGFPDDERVRVEIDETSPLARWSLTSTDPVTLTTEGGAFEDTRRPRVLSVERTQDVVGRFLLKVLDRRGPFVDAPPDKELTLAHHVAWDVYAVGRLAALGQPGQRQRRLYQFWNRHGFTDAATATFDELWNGRDLTWADVRDMSDRCRQVLDPA